MASRDKTRRNPLDDDLNCVVRATEELWEEVRGLNIFITGGTGFFGCWLLETFLRANDSLGLGASATVLARQPQRLLQTAPHLATHPAVRLLAGDVRTFEFPEGRFPFVIHAATESSAALNQWNPGLMFETIVEGTRRTLSFAHRAGARRVLLCSSGAVYGPQPSDLTHIPESYQGAPDCLEPASAYAEGKRAAEMLCALAHAEHGLQTLVARCFAFVGPYLPLDRHFAIGNFIRDCVAGGPIRLTGDGTPYRSYLYAADLAAWLWTILFRGEAVRPYNVGSEADLPLLEVATRVAACAQPPVAVEVARRAESGQAPKRYVPSTARARSELGLRETVGLDAAIERTIQWVSGDQREARLP